MKQGLQRRLAACSWHGWLASGPDSASARVPESPRSLFRTGTLLEIPYVRYLTCDTLLEIPYVRYLTCDTLLAIPYLRYLT